MTIRQYEVGSWWGVPMARPLKRKKAKDDDRVDIARLILSAASEDVLLVKPFVLALAELLFDENDLGYKHRFIRIALGNK